MHGSLWQRCLRQLEGEVPEQQFNTWVRPLQAVAADNVLRLYAPNRFVLDWVQQNLYARIVELASQEAPGTGPQVLIEVGSRPKHPDETPPAAGPASGAVAAQKPLPAVGGRVNPDFNFDAFV
ncbi:MAG TPA: DnaA N-terminal domain-containing protein, partial [Gammaproteobacteria bacterium]